MSLLGDRTPRSTWTGDLPIAGPRLAEMLAPFGSSPVVVKDFVKSRKHEWHEAFFIPDASDTEYALRIVQTFIERQGAELAGGIVLREYVSLVGIGTHQQSGMPLGREYRAFVFHGQIIAAGPYWDVGNDDVEGPPYNDFLAPLTDLSPFFTLDLGQTVDGRWIVIETGDAQVSALPPVSVLFRLLCLDGRDLALSVRLLEFSFDPPLHLSDALSMTDNPDRLVAHVLSRLALV